MSGSIIGAVCAGDFAQVRALLDSGADVHTRDEHEWTPLNWAAGRGDLERVQLLVERGADVYQVGRDQRTPYLIALAAGHAPVARFLRNVESRGGGDSSQSSQREKTYCKAYYLRELRRFSGWLENSLLRKTGEASVAPESSDDDVVFIHQDLTVTKSMWQGEDVLFDSVAPGWREFCDKELGFSVPDDIELIERQKPRATESSEVVAGEARP